KSDYFPIKLSIESVNGSNKQLAVYELESIRSIPEKGISLIRHSADSVFLSFKQYTNGDSIKMARLNKYRDFKIGDTLRLFDGLTVNDDTVSIKDHLDSILIIDFFYTTCKPCLSAIPEINRVWEAYNGKGVSFFGLNGLANDWKNISQFLSLYQPKYNILKIPQQVIYDFGVKQYPRLFVLKNGVLIKVFYGFKPGTDKELIELIEKLKMN
ncbi:MAG TPA: TlpA disulfide reductase family protein, partial [Bacteroidia bacterium]